MNHYSRIHPTIDRDERCKLPFLLIHYHLYTSENIVSTAILLFQIPFTDSNTTSITIKPQLTIATSTTTIISIYTIAI